MLQPYLSLVRRTVGLSLFLPIIVTLCSSGSYQDISSSEFAILMIVACSMALYFWNAACRLLKSCEPALQVASEGQIRFIDDLPDK